MTLRFAGLGPAILRKPSERVWAGGGSGAAIRSIFSRKITRRAGRRSLCRMPAALDADGLSLELAGELPPFPHIPFVLES
jgi:hypothetical protein